MDNAELEKVVLCGIIFLEQLEEINENDFSLEIHKKICKAINQIKDNKQELNIFNIADKIKDYNRLNVIEYVSSIVDYKFNSYGSFGYAYKELKKYAAKKTIYLTMQEYMKKLESAENLENLTQEMITDLRKIKSKEEPEVCLEEQLFEAIKDIENKITNKDNTKYFTPIFDLNKLTNGLHEGELTIIGARPGTGKTTLALQFATTIAKRGVRTLFLSLEMTETSLINKIFSCECNIDSNLIRTGNIKPEHIDSIVQKQSELANVPLHISSKCKSIQQIEIMARKLYNTKGLGLLVIDYLQLIRNSKKFNSREQEVADISKTLKQLALELKIPIIAVCQVSRNAQRQIPVLSDLRESGSLEQDADNVIFLYSEEEQNDGEDQDITYMQDLMLKLAKQREGITGTIRVRFRKNINKFENITR